MKLKSELYETRDGGKDVYWRNRESEVEHDAMAAHALLQAMGEYESAEDGWANAYAAKMKKRAAEILAGWLGEE